MTKIVQPHECTTDYSLPVIQYRLALERIVDECADGTPAASLAVHFANTALSGHGDVREA